MKKKYAMTLLEIMIVIFIIGIIGSVIGFNMRGSLEQAKAFKTKEAARKLYEIVLLEEANNKKVESSANDPYHELYLVVKNSELVRRPSDIMKDGWGNKFEFDYDEQTHEWHFVSEKYETFCKAKDINTNYPWETDKDDPSH